MNMSLVWAVIVGVIVLLIIYGIVGAKLAEAKRKKEKKESMPDPEDRLRVGRNYNFHLNDGTRLMDHMLVGKPMRPDWRDEYGGWDGMIILKDGSGKRIFLKERIIRIVEEI